MEMPTEQRVMETRLNQLEENNEVLTNPRQSGFTTMINFVVEERRKRA